MTTLDHYLLRRYLHAFWILFASVYGLYVVIDGFTNVDGFQENQETTLDVLAVMARYYGFQSMLFFDMVGSMLTVVATMVVFGLLVKNGEFHPVLAAGVPARRLMLPVVAGTMIISGLIVVNQEFVIPSIAHVLMKPRSADDDSSRKVEPLYDLKTQIHIGGRELSHRERKVLDAEFVLPVPHIARELTTLKAREAVFVEATADRPAGWLLREVTPPLAEVQLTPAGTRHVRSTGRAGEAFIVTEVSFDQLNNRSKYYRFLSTPQLVERIRNPSSGIVALRSQTMHFHTRLLRPLLNIVAVMGTVPLILRRESRSLLGNLAVCALIMGLLWGLVQLFPYLGEVNLLSPDFAAWASIIVCAAVCAWLSGWMQT